MRKYCLLLTFLLCGFNLLAADALLQNAYLRNKITLNGRWHYIVESIRKRLL